MKNISASCRPFILLLVLITLFLSCAQGAFARVTKGPVLLRVESSRAAVMWEADTAAQDSVAWGIDKPLTTKTSAAGFRVEYKDGSTKKTAFIFKTWIKNLQPGQTYRYRIISENEQSPEYSFRTVAATPEKIRFAVYGDSRKHPDTHRRVVEQIIRANVDFVVHTGDLVNSGVRYKEWGPQFFEPVKGLAEYVPVYMVKGNHDAGGFFERFFVMDKQRNYSITIGALYYFFADNTTGDLATADLLKVLGRDRAKDAAKWKFVSWHEPNLNLGGHMSDRGNPHALEKLSAERIDFVIAGHSHMYERFRPVAGPVGSTGSAVTCITTGGGGADLADVQPDFLLARAAKENHFCLFEISGDDLSMQAINIEGEVIDRLRLTNTAGRLDGTYTDSSVELDAVLFHQQLVGGLSAYTHTKPGKGKTFQATLKISKLKLDRVIKLKCQPRSPGKHFEQTEVQTVTVGPSSGEIKLRFQVTSRVDADLTYKKHLDPALYIHCEYDTPYGKAWTAVPVEYN